MADAAEPAKQPRRRQRPGLSCLECRRRKVKCNQAKPCDQCTKGRRPECSYGPRSNAAAVSTLPWASGKPETFGPSGEVLRGAGSTVADGLTTHLPQASTLDGSYIQSQPVALQPRPPHLPTPATSSEGRATATSEIASASDNVSTAITPGSHCHPSPWIGSDKRDQSAINPIDNAGRMLGNGGSIDQNQCSDSASFARSKLPDNSRVSAFGRSLPPNLYIISFSVQLL